MTQNNFKDADEFFSYLENLFFENNVLEVKTSKNTDIYEGSGFEFMISKNKYILIYAKLKKTNFSQGYTLQFCSELYENELEVIYQTKTNPSKAKYFMEKLKAIYTKNLALKKYNILNNFEKIEKKDDNVFIFHHSSSSFIMLFKEQVLFDREVKSTPKVLFHNDNKKEIIKVINEDEYEALIAILNSYNDIYNNDKIQLKAIELLSLLKE